MADVQKEVDAWVSFYDTNKDGKVHKDEYFALPKSNQQYWDSVDINNDEYVADLRLRCLSRQLHFMRRQLTFCYYVTNAQLHWPR